MISGLLLLIIRLFIRTKCISDREPLAATKISVSPSWPVGEKTNVFSTR